MTDHDWRPPPATPVLPMTGAEVGGRPAGAHKVRDYATGEGHRFVDASRSPSPAACGWHERPDAYWALRMFTARRGWLSGFGTNQESTVYAGQAALAKVELLEHSVAAPPVSERPRPLCESDATEIADDPALLRIVSVLRSAISAADGQLAALVGATGREFPDLARPLIGCGMAAAAMHHAPGLPWPRIRLWRLRAGPAYYALAREVLRRGLGPSVFGSASPSGASDFSRGRDSRHMAIAVEMCLRAMEVRPDVWRGWLPEGQCRPAAWLPPGHPMSGTESKAIADACLVRGDGMRLFVEVEASTPAVDRIGAKVEAWSQFLSTGETQAAVLFAAAAQPSQMGACSQALRRAVEAHANPSVHDRFLVGSWHDWSPDFGIVSTDAGTLRCAVRAGGVWRETHACDHPIPATDDGLADRVAECGWAPEWRRPAP